MSIPASLVWIPDIAFTNEATGVYNKDFLKYFLVVVFSNSFVRWSPAGTVSIKCLMDVTHFPFDVQTCDFTFESWMYLKEEVLLQAGADNTDQLVKTSFHGLSEIMHTKYFKKLDTYSTGNFSQLVFSISLRRKPTYYLVYMVAPCVILVVLNVFLFVLHPASGEKVSLGTAIVLSYFVFLLMTQERFPPNSSCMPLFSVYIIFSMNLSALSFGCSSVIIYLYHNPKTSVPKWLKMVFFSQAKGQNSVKPKPQRNSLLCCASSKTINTRKTNMTFKNFECGCAKEQNSSLSRSQYEEWYLVVKKLDRILLIVYSLIVVILTTILTVMVMHKYTKEFDQDGLK